MRLLLLQQCVSQVAIALLLLQLRLHYVGVGRFAGALPLLGQDCETGSFARGTPRHTLCGQRPASGRRGWSGINESAAGNFELRRGNSLRGAARETAVSCCSPNVSEDECLGWHTLAPHCWRYFGEDWLPIGPPPLVRAIGLGIKVLDVIRSVRQQSGLCYRVIERSDTRRSPAAAAKVGSLALASSRACSNVIATGRGSRSSHLFAARAPRSLHRDNARGNERTSYHGLWKTQYSLLGADSLLPDHQYGEAAGNNRRPWTRVGRRRSGPLAEVAVAR